MSEVTAGMVSAFERRSAALQEYVIHHVRDSHELGLPGLCIRLPGWLSVDTLMMWIAAALLLVLFGWIYRKRDPGAPRGITNALEALVVFVRDDIAMPHLGVKDGRRMTPLLCSLFFFILAVNLLGLLPGFASATANLGVTGALAAVSFAVMIFGAIYARGPAAFFRSFVPPGVPGPILVLLLPLEMLGVLIKSAALMIRLFANMLAGHMVILFMIGMFVLLGFWGLPFVLLAVMIMIIEIGVAFLQAYIFTLLSAVFIGQRYRAEH